MLKLENINITFNKNTANERKALQHIDLDVADGDFVTVIGSNGAGKSTLMKILFGIETPEEGEILLNEKPIKINNPLTAINYGIGMVHQHFMLVPSLTVAENMVLGMEPSSKGLLSLGKAYKLVEDIAEKFQFDINPRAKVEDIPVGTKQKVEILKALLRGAKILILDEPTAGLDPKERVRFRNLISSLAENKIVILSTHIVSDVEYIANEILIMKNGELIQHGSPEKLLKPIEKCVWECDVSRKEAEELELNYVTANLKHNNGAERLRIISQEAPCRTAWNVDPTLEDLYLYYFAEVSEHE